MLVGIIKVNKPEYANAYCPILFTEVAILKSDSADAAE